MDTELLDQIASLLENQTQKIQEYVDSRLQEHTRQIQEYVDGRLQEHTRQIQEYVDSRLQGHTQQIQEYVDNCLQKQTHQIDTQYLQIKIMIENNIAKRISTLFDGYQLVHDRELDIEKQNQIFRRQIDDLQIRLTSLEQKSVG